MQIRNNYGHNYQPPSDTHSHTHHITRCLHEDEQKKLESGAMRRQAETESGKESLNTEDKETVNELGGQGVQGTSLKKGIGIFRGLWDSLGDEPASLGEKPVPYEGHRGNLSGIYGALVGWKQAFTEKIVYKWDRTSQRLKVGIHSAMKRFGRGGEAFGALTEEESRSGKGRRAAAAKGMLNTKKTASKETGIEGQAPELITAFAQENHLLDSYTKTGEYCKLGDTFKS